MNFRPRQEPPSQFSAKLSASEYGITGRRRPIIRTFLPLPRLFLARRERTSKDDELDRRREIRHRRSRQIYEAERQHARQAACVRRWPEVSEARAPRCLF